MYYDEKAMQTVIQKAKESLEFGSLPLAAALVDRSNGLVIKAFGKYDLDESDPTLHPEIAVIRYVATHYPLVNLADYALFSNVPPCHGCLGFAISFTNIGRVVYAAGMSDMQKNSYGFEDYTPEEFAKNLRTYDGSAPEVVGGVLRDQSVALLRGMENWQVVT